MTEWWKLSYKRRMNERSLLMALLRITLYGSFQPLKQKEKLKEVVDYLRSQGFEDTDIVEGEKRPNEWGYNSFEISIFYLEESDANFLIFTREGARLGVTTECDHILMSPTMCKKWSSCIIFNQIEGDQESLGKLQKDRLMELNQLRIRIPVVPFETWEDLKDSAYLHAIDFFKAMGPVLRSRVS